MRKLLLPFSLLFWLGVTIRNWFFDIGIIKTTKVGVPVISVGNISTGGVGKTPIVEMLIEKLVVSNQWSVVSRGYGRKSSGTIVVSNGRGSFASIEDSGDEPSQLARKYPKQIIIADEQRVRGAQKAIELGAKMIILDDGFQHRYLHRDINIVVMTAEEILNGDWLLPAGNRREPLSALKRADSLVISRCNDIAEFEQAKGTIEPRFKTRPRIIGVQTKLKSLRKVLSKRVIKNDNIIGKKVIAFSGIGNPKSFDDLLLKANITVAKYYVFPDHHWYSDSDIQKLVKARKELDADFIITTEKDVTRLKERFAEFLKTEPVVIADIRQEIIAGEITFEELAGRMKK